MVTAPTLPISLSQLIDSDLLDQFYQQAIQTFQNADANNKAGVAESAAARGQAWMNVDTLMGDYLATDQRGQIAGALLDLLAKLYELSLQITLEQIRHGNNVELENIQHQHLLERMAAEFSYNTQLEAQRIAGQVTVINAQRDAEQSTIQFRYDLNKADWDEYLAFIQSVYNKYHEFVEEILLKTITGGEDFILAAAELISAQAQAIRQPILPPAPPRV